MLTPLATLAAQQGDVQVGDVITATDGSDVSAPADVSAGVG